MTDEINIICPYCKCHDIKSKAKLVPSNSGDILARILKCENTQCEGNGSLWYGQKYDAWYVKIKRWFKRLVS